MACLQSNPAESFVKLINVTNRYVTLIRYAFSIQFGMNESKTDSNESRMQVLVVENTLIIYMYSIKRLRLYSLPAFHCSFSILLSGMFALIRATHEMLAANSTILYPGLN